MNLIISQESAHISQWLCFVHQKVYTNNLKCEPEKILFYFTGKLKAKSIKDLIVLKYGTFLVFLLQIICVSMRRQRAWYFESECTDHLLAASKNMRNVLVRTDLVKVNSMCLWDAYEIPANICMSYFSGLAH